MILKLEQCHVRRGEHVLFQPEWGCYDLLIGETVVTAHAGAADSAYWRESEFGSHKVPRRPNLSHKQQALLDDYTVTLRALAGNNKQHVLATIDRVYQHLTHLPDEWLLRWNLLESLIKMDCGVRLSHLLVRELKQIEERNYKDVPVTMGLQYLGLA